MRVTAGSASRGALAGLQADAARLATLQRQITSGRQITKPSDSPTGTVTALQLRSQLKQLNQYQANANDALGWLTTVDSTLHSMTSQLQQVRSLVLQGMNTGTGNAASNEALAQQVDQARASLLSLANSSYLGRPVFGGTTAGGVAFDTAGSYAGDTGTVTRTVGPNNAIDLNTPGTATFGPNGSNLFDLLTDISAKLRTNPSGLGADLAQLDARQVAITNEQSLAGAKYQRIQSVQNTANTNLVQLKSQLSDLQEIDLADMAIQVTSANAAYQAALATTAKVSQISLLDFLR
ncbi:flagellar hook-associated protein FlgL [Jatrophihabitans sp.]|uniref:flagellar hook-associated protein FlgL n=1 Tax=Jatrophihabitans sp. TaxID=1932789 RepID=UPI002BF5C262|nr:flagellar hook-associated protein FlgL [Jatrophihabitans sp.]